MLTQRNQYLPFFMWFFPLAFFTYQFVLRLWPGLMMHQMMEQFSIDASSFGLLAAFYYYGYSGMQIPVAILLERYNPRYVIFAFAVLCGLATLLLTYTTHFYLALLGRLLIGAGSAVGFLGISKVVSEWFSKEKYARMIALSFTFGLMGAIWGGKPISLLIENYSWKSVALTLALISLVIGFTTYAFLRTPKNEKNLLGQNQFRLKNFKAIFSSPLIWFLAVSNLLMVGSLEGFADVWGVPYLMLAFDLSKSNAAGLVSFIFFGMLIGGPLLVLCTKKLGNYFVISACGLLMALAFVLLLSNSLNNTLLLSVLFFCVGVLCCYQVIVFAAGAKLVSPENLGVTVAFLNCVNMLGGSFFHTIIGNMMDLYWTGATGTDGLRVYDMQVYKYSLSIIPMCATLGALIVLLIGVKVRRRNLWLAQAEQI